MLSETIKKPFRIVKNYCLDVRATKYLKYNYKKKHSIGKRMKVGFIVFEPETWDKIEPIYKEFKTKINISTELIIVPSFDQELKLTTRYGKELDFFRDIDSSAIIAYSKGKWINVEKYGYDYIFYQDPYNLHMPPIFRSDNIVRFAKICYLPYGIIGSDVFIQNNINKDFFRNVYRVFTDIQDIQSLLSDRYKNNVKKGYQNFLQIGYPALMRYTKYEYRKQIKNILWTPRWSYHPIIGGSNFLKFKDKFIAFAKENKDYSCRIRPHPMMFKTIINEGLFSEEDKMLYYAQAAYCGVKISVGKDLDSDFYNTDLLITDFSSIIPQFFMTKRPIIYCASQIVFNDFYSELAKGMYIANTWDEVLYYVGEIKKGNDYLYQERINIINKLAIINVDSEKRIVNYLIDDYDKTTI